MQLHKMVSKAIHKYNPNAVLIEENSDTYLKKYNIKNIPGLIIDDKLVSQGKVLSEREIGKLIAISD